MCADKSRNIITWNQKNLDYEIETHDPISDAYAQRAAWNQKNLDYEIETESLTNVPIISSSAWNQKNLDYEIETIVFSLLKVA